MISENRTLALALFGKVHILNLKQKRTLNLDFLCVTLKKIFEPDVIHVSCISSKFSIHVSMYSSLPEKNL